MKNPDYFNKYTSEKLQDKLKPVSEANNLSILNIVKEVNKFYWRFGVRHSMIANSAVFVKHLGTIVVSRRKLIKEIKLVILKIRKIKFNKRLTEKKRQILLDSLYSDLKLLLERRNELAQLYYKKPNE